MTKLELALEISKLTKFSEEFLLNQTEEDLQKTYDILIKERRKYEQRKLNEE